MSSIKDVAKRSGVSVATVSRVLNNKGYVSEDTRKKVELAIRDLDYKPNEVARSLFTKQSKTVGLLVPDIMNPYFPELARAVEDTVTNLGYNLILCNTDDNQEKEQLYLDVLLQKYVDGMIVVSNTLTAEQISKLNVPVISIDREISRGIPTIVVENYKGAQMAARYLLSKGRKKIGHLRGPSGVRNSDERFEGYKDIVSKEAWFEESLIESGSYDMQSGMEACARLLERHPDVDAIFAANDTMAIGAIKAVYQSGKNVPEDIAVIGFDGITFGEAMNPGLTTIAQPIYELGEQAASWLIGLIEGQKLDKTFYTLSVELVERHST